MASTCTIAKVLLRCDYDECPHIVRIYPGVGMEETGRFHMRIPVADRHRLRELAELAQRSESDVVRLLIRAARPGNLASLVTVLAPTETREPAQSERQAA